MGTDATWNFMDPASRDTLLTTLRKEADGFFALAGEAEWEAQNRLHGVAGAGRGRAHDDVTEGYFVGFDHARQGSDAPGAIGLPAMADRPNDHARSFRSLPAPTHSSGRPRTTRG